MIGILIEFLTSVLSGGRFFTHSPPSSINSRNFLTDVSMNRVQKVNEFNPPPKT